MSKKLLSAMAVALLCAVTIFSACGTTSPETSPTPTPEPPMPSKVSIALPSNLYNSDLQLGSLRPLATVANPNQGPAYQFLKNYVTLSVAVSSNIDTMLGYLSSVYDYLYLTRGKIMTNSGGTSWWYFNQTNDTGYVYSGPVTNSTRYTNLYIDWAKESNGFKGMARFYDLTGADEIQEATVFYDAASATNSLDVYVLPREGYTFITNFHIVIRKLSTDEVTVQAKVLCVPYFSNYISDSSWVDSWDIAGYGKMNSAGCGKAHAQGLYSNAVYLSTNMEIAANNGTEYLMTVSNLYTATDYDYGEFFSISGTTDWKLGWAVIDASEYLEITNIQTNTFGIPVELSMALVFATNFSATVTNNSDTYPLLPVIRDITTNVMGDTTNFITNYNYINSTAKPAALSSILDGIGYLPYEPYTNADSMMKPIK